MPKEYHDVHALFGRVGGRGGGRDEYFATNHEKLLSDSSAALLESCELE
jgi:hypothetical protein